MTTDSTASPQSAAPALPAATVAPETDDALPHDRYLNRELSWLEFNSRVLALAEDPSAPLLERAKFLAIYASNLDEFYMVRVAGLMRRAKAGLSVRSADGMSPSDQVERIRRTAQERANRHAAVFTDQIVPGLAEAGIELLDWSQLSPTEAKDLSAYFHEQVYPVLTPLAVDPSHPFPYISGLSLNLAVTVRAPDGGGEHFARVKVPPNVPRLVRVPRTAETAAEDPQSRADGQVYLLPLEELIAAHLNVLFQGMEVVGHHLFRVTRNADLSVDEDRDEDLLQALERELERRRFGSPVRLEVADDISAHMLELLLRELDVDEADVVRVPGLLDLTGLWQIHGLDRPELKDAPYVPETPPQFGERETPKNIFAALREGDILVHHPYDSFSTTVQRFIEQAAADESVLAIKQTLYRTSGDSPIVDALIEAANAGKQVVALVEIKARFDEEANISWGRKLEQAGVHVVYGMLGLKTHCKTCLVVRREGSVLRRYCHIGTGNYNPGTARLYEDLGLFTADPAIGADLTDLFNSLTGYSQVREFRNLLVAPRGLRPGVLELIDAEIEHHRAGRAAGITIKANALVDEQVIDALYRASQAGVPVRILVRGICALRPQVPGLSENIRVRSILGRFLEHSRILHFVGSDEHWIGSADMMHRNLDRRVEVFVQVHDPQLRAVLTDVLDLAFDPAVRSWELCGDGSWLPLPAGETDTVLDYHRVLIDRHDHRHG